MLDSSPTESQVPIYSSSKEPCLFSDPIIPWTTEIFLREREVGWK